MEWAEVIKNPMLRNLPFKIELNKFGQLLMSPASNWHGTVQAKITAKLSSHLKGGTVITECSIRTSDGVKVADVAWGSDEFMEAHGYSTPYPKAPEICVEIFSPSNTEEGIMQKVELHLAKGAQEVWVVAEGKKLRFFDHKGMMKSSKLVARFKI